jgi:hypothetical protein
MLKNQCTGKRVIVIYVEAVKTWKMSQCEVNLMTFIDKPTHLKNTLGRLVRLYLN